MGNLHWLILIPFYFFGALGLLLASMATARVLRLRVSVNPLVVGAVLASMALLVVPLAAGWASIDDYSGLALLALVLVTFVVAALDTLLEPLLPLPLDKELNEL